MKKIIILLCLYCFFISVHAQVNTSKNINSSSTNRSNQSGQTSQTTQNNKNVKNQLQQGNQLVKVKFTPKPDKIYIKNKRVFNVLYRPSRIMDNKSNIQSNKQLSTTMNNQSVNMANKQVAGTSSTYIKSKTAYSIHYTTSKNIGGHKVTYLLTDDVSKWDNTQVFNPKFGPKGQKQLSPDKQWNCQTSSISLTAQSTSFMNPNPEDQGSFLLPGMIYSFDDVSGNFNQRYNFNRNPITLVSDVLDSRYPVSTDVTDPNMATISTGISSIINQFTPAQAGSDYQLQYYLTNNNSDQDIFVSAGGSYGAFSGSNTFRHSQNDHHFYFTIDAVKTMYTINVQPSQDGFYKNANVPSSNSPLLMIQNVSFGARVLANMDVEIKSTTDTNALKLSYDDGVESGKLDLQTLFANSSVNVSINGYLIGFPTKFPGSFSATKENFFAIMDQFFSGCDYRSAKPVKYRFVNMNGDELGIASATDQFTVPDCYPADEIFTLQQPVLLNIRTGADNKNSDSEFDLYITGERNDGGKGGFGIFMNSSTEFKSNSNSGQLQIDFTSALKNDPNHPNGYTLDDFNKDIRIDIKFSHGVNFHTGDDWDISNLQLTLNFLSQKGTPKKIPITIPNFRLSSGNGNPDWDTKTFWFNPDGSVKQ